MPSGHLGVPSRRSAEQAQWGAERARCRAARGIVRICPTAFSTVSPKTLSTDSPNGPLVRVRPTALSTVSPNDP